jgi:hypothetical protein
MCLSRTLKMGPIGCPESSVRNYYCTLRKIPQEHRCHLNRRGSLKSRVVGSMSQEVTFGDNFRKALHSDRDVFNSPQTYCVTQNTVKSRLRDTTSDNNLQRDTYD